MNKITGLIILVLFLSGQFQNLNANSVLPEQGLIIMGMVLLDDPKSLQIEKVVEELEKKWDLKVESEFEGSLGGLTVQGQEFLIGLMPMPVPEEEIKSVAKFNYFWEDGLAEATKHKAHVIVTLLDAGKEPVQENIIFSKVASAVLSTTVASGIYVGSRTLLLKKEFYLDGTATMSEDSLPLPLWLYIGMIKGKKKQSVYTYGLAEFGKKEMEIVESKRSLEELNEMLYNMVYYVIGSDVTLNDGETIGLTAKQKLKITESKGVFLDGQTLKIDY